MRAKGILQIIAGVLFAITLNGESRAEDSEKLLDSQQFNPGQMYKCTKVVVITNGQPGSPIAHNGDIIHVNFGPNPPDADYICNMRLIVAVGVSVLHQTTLSKFTATEVHRTLSTVDVRLDSDVKPPNGWQEASSIQVVAYGYLTQ